MGESYRFAAVNSKINCRLRACFIKMNADSGYWLFDLDNTLHHADAGVLPLINQRMTAYLADALHISKQQASALRQDYWQRYGATLAGLQKHHPQIDVMDFLRQSHPLNLILAACQPMENMATTLAQLPGRKAVFSNGPSFYVQALCHAMNIDVYFERLLGTDDFGLLYKPNPLAYHNVCAQLGTAAAYCIMVDDNADNLRTAKTLGMRTVWCTHHTETPAFVDYRADSMTALSDIAHCLVQPV